MKPRMAHRWLCAGLCLFLLAFTGSASASATDAPDILLLQEALLAGKYEHLEQILTSVQQRYLSGVTDDQPMAHAFRAFRSTDPAISDRLLDWVTRHPQSSLAHAARGAHLSHLGWTSRGTAYSRDTSERQFRRMREFFGEARAELHQAILLEPTLSMAYAEAIRLDKSDGDDLESASIKNALHQCPRSFTVRYWHLVGLQPKWGGSLEAMEAFIAASVDLRTNPSLASLRGFRDYTIADQLRGNGRNKEAIDHYSKAIAAGDHWVFYLDRAKAKAAAKRDPEAIADLTIALDLSPHNTDVLSERADTYTAIKRPDLAMSDISRALRLDPLNPNLLQTRAVIYEQQGKADEALADYKNSLVFNPDDPHIYLRMGEVEQNLRKDLLAATALKHKAAELAPDRARYWFMLAEVLMERKQCETRYALVRYQKACETREDEACALVARMWAKGTLAWLRSNPGCKKITDDTPPEY